MSEGLDRVREVLDPSLIEKNRRKRELESQERARRQNTANKSKKTYVDRLLLSATPEDLDFILFYLIDQNGGQCPLCGQILPPEDEPQEDTLED